MSVTRKANKIPGIVRKDSEGQKGNALFPFHKCRVILHLGFKGHCWLQHREDTGKLGTMKLMIEGRKTHVVLCKGGERRDRHLFWGAKKDFDSSL